MLHLFNKLSTKDLRRLSEIFNKERSMITRQYNIYIENMTKKQDVVTKLLEKRDEKWHQNNQAQV